MSKPTTPRVTRDPNKLLALAATYLLDGARYTALLYLRLAEIRVEEEIAARNHLMCGGPLPDPRKFNRRSQNLIRKADAQRA